MVAWAHHRAKRHRADWLYAHPYDFDTDEPRWVVDEVGRLGSRLLWHGRRRMARRVRRVVAGCDVTLAQLAAACHDAPTFAPSRMPSHIWTASE